MQALEAALSELVTDKQLFARIDRPAGIVQFVKTASEDETLVRCSHAFVISLSFKFMHSFIRSLFIYSFTHSFMHSSIPSIQNEWRDDVGALLTKVCASTALHSSIIHSFVHHSFVRSFIHRRESGLTLGEI